MNQAIYEFLCNYLTTMNVPFHALADRTFLMPDLDGGLRNTILKDYQRETISSLEEFSPQGLYHFSDYYNCNYTFFQMPDGHFFYIGPYLLRDMHETDIRQMLNATEMPESLFPSCRTTIIVFRSLPIRTLFLPLSVWLIKKYANRTP